MTRTAFRLVLVTVLLAALSASPHARGTGDELTIAERVGEAIVHAVVQRVGGDPRVTVTVQHVGYSGDGAVVATPEPGARTGAPARFVLHADGRRVGTAVATADVSLHHVRAKRAIARHEEFTPADLELSEGVLAGELIRRVPMLDDVVGARARRAIAAGEAITSSVIDVPPLVRSGDHVTVIFRVGSVEAEGRGVASGSGHEGDVIGVLTPNRRRPHRARIIGPRVVEVLQ